MNVGSAHLTYCTNIHPGETWSEVRANLQRHTVSVRERLGCTRFGVGLRLSGNAAAELRSPDRLAELRDFLRASGLYVFTINGFPYGPFHGRSVKEEVYRPDWTELERVAYTLDLADVLAGLLPGGMRGSISTVPGAFAPRAGSDAAREAIRENLVTVAIHLARLERERGIDLCLALEPEPACLLETTDDAVGFFEAQLFGTAARARVAAETGLDANASEALLRRHLGVCLDTCHAAVEFEAPRAAIERLRGAGVRIAKVQLSAGLRLPCVGADVVTLLAPFRDEVYLHQVVEKAEGGLQRYLDLEPALAALCERVRTQGAMAAPTEWRVHFHVPIFLAPAPPLESTQDFLIDVVDLHRGDPDGICDHLEVETYTWDVLPKSHRGAAVVDDVVRELCFVRDRLLAE